MLVTDCSLKAECNFGVQFVVMERVQEGCGVREFAHNRVRNNYVHKPPCFI
jgi:hypothetical protein